MRGFLRWRKREAFLELAKRKICDVQVYQVRTGNAQMGREIADFGVPADKEFPLGRVDTVPRE